METFIAIYIFILAAFTGSEVISKVPAILHTPLMSGSNFIHGVVLVGAIIALGMAETNLEKTIGDLEKKIVSLEYSCDTNSNEIEAVNAAIDDLEPDISEVEYPK